MVKQSLKKQPTVRRDITLIPTSPEIIPAALFYISGKSPGILAVEVATPNGTNNLTEGTNKNELRVKGRSLPK